MKREQLLEIGISEEHADKVVEIFNQGNYIPHARFNQVNEAKKDLEGQLADRDKQLDELKKASGDVESLKAKIEEAQANNAAIQEKYEADMKAFKINSAIDLELAQANAKSLKATKAMLDMDNISINDKGEIEGLQEQIKSLREGEDTSFLFSPAHVKGMVPRDTGSQTPEPKNFGEEMAELANQNEKASVDFDPWA